MELIKRICGPYTLELGRISKRVFCKFSHFTDFPNILALSPCKKTLELLEVIHETVTLTKVSRKNAIIVNFKKIYFA